MRAAAFLLLIGAATAAEAQPQLASVFTDHAVLQRDRPLTIWGNAAPREQVSVAFAGTTRTTRADRSGQWRVELPAQPAGGPHRLVATGADGRADAADDILVGDVWLCSGQSNMEFPVRQALNGDGEAGSASDPNVRVLTVPQRRALEPQSAIDASWQVATPDSMRDFSAACWFMVRELRRSENVPIGAIHASWGGTRIRPWMSAAAATASGGAGDAELLALYRRDPVAAAARFGELWGSWWRERSGDSAGAEPWRQSARLEWRPIPSIQPWEGWNDPAFADFNGFVWARRRVTLTEAEARAGATLSLGVVDDLDTTWVNGVAVGSTFGWSEGREYRVPANLLRAGENEILVNIGDSWAYGGFQGPADRLRLILADGSVKPLGDGWEYSVVPNGYGSPPRAPWDSHAGLSVIYNGMIAPLGQYGLRGVAWYQGESDVGVAGYADRLAAMMGDWRRQFASPQLPFLIVSLANFGPPSTAPRPSGWAELREQQRIAAVRDPNAAIVVAMDLGERADIHPPNKQEVGRRLARAARALAYDGREPASGPEAARARREGDAIVIDFAGVTGRLQSWGSNQAIGFELCGADQQSCRFATATVAGSQVRIQADGQPATRVRYAWGEFPVVNLYDEAVLPAGPFELPID